MCLSNRRPGCTSARPSGASRAWISRLKQRTESIAAMPRNCWASRRRRALSTPSDSAISHLAGPCYDVHQAMAQVSSMSDLCKQPSNRKLATVSAAILALTSVVRAQNAIPSGVVSSPQAERTLLDRYCVVCHSEKAKAAGNEAARKMTLDTLDVTHVEKD